MGSILLIVAVATLAFVWLRGTRRNRARWLNRLDLPGVWERQGEPGKLELKGQLDGGTYRLSGAAAGDNESGKWLLEGHTLCLTKASGTTVDYDLRLFQEGKIGINNGPRGEHRVYQKVPSNVVPLRGRSGG